MNDLNNFNDRIEEFHKNGMQALFSVFESTCKGAVAIDLTGHIVWISSQYEDLLNELHIPNPMGKNIEEVIPNSLLCQVVETGRPILLDLMRLGKEWVVVTRVPLFDDQGECFGAMGFILMGNKETLKPLLTKVERLQKELYNTRKLLASSRQSKYTFSDFVGASKSIKDMKLQARKAAQLDSPVLILGETGTGKELLSHAIHSSSPRSQAPFISINVAAIPENLLEAEFFGTAPGAYTGADKRGRDGKLKLAERGTLFLDEIGDMPLHVQSKLLRVLQEKEFEPVGSNTIIKTDLRIVAATSRDLPQMVQDGSFRADLYYRLNVVPLKVPPLREHLADIEHLCNTLLEKQSLAVGSEIFKMSPEALEICHHYSWPGNVRELQNILERVTTIASSCVISGNDFLAALPIEEIPALNVIGKTTLETSVRPLDEVIQEAEKKAILDALVLSGNNKQQASRLLKISRGRLYDKMNALGIPTSHGSS